MENLLVAGVVIMLECELQEDETTLVPRLQQVLFTVVIKEALLSNARCNVQCARIYI